ncbi:radical activating enzyme [Sphaerisporangium krabiense]|uniref:Anaerobic ribonucleoside-triphosphate reductase activating protein n=1 Tax=Sphaerisporangium krabiense TaxID=763782 RepID=A0A7W9DMP5_9ACTN|nr:4Fe-4S single cluster domain-containing protein [Sphaerisporangium krabiense]MBB5624577.1 anaerobic ribonucleoside-triphosphate reductase activating protein [Sphaerisporangium krabiense]GII61468.1 radical activating enzyme [Sphaerisporangium krabiense]
MTALRVGRVHYPVTALGPGRRLGVWTQGCPLACPGCMSRDTWDPAGGEPAPVAGLEALWRAALAAGADGLTVSGGEPLAQPGPLAAFLDRARAVRDAVRPEADILLYTGYELEELDEPRLAAVAHADVLITGRYEVTRPTRLPWRGSAGQRLIARTDLGRARYAARADTPADRVPVQVVPDGRGGVLVIGVPPPGTLARMERALRAGGVRLDRPSWRP